MSRGPRAPDTSAYRVVQFGLTGERLDQRADLPGHQAVEEGHGCQLALPFLLEDRQRLGSEHFGDPRHVSTLGALYIWGMSSMCAGVQSDCPPGLIDGQSAGHQSPCGSVVCPTSMM